VYAQKRFSKGDAAGEAVNDFKLYRLNCRPVRAIPAHGSVRFAMVAEVPSPLEPGRRFSVTWRLLAPAWTRAGAMPAARSRSRSHPSNNIPTDVP
jgi:hypothetical protein